MSEMIFKKGDNEYAHLLMAAYLMNQVAVRYGFAPDYEVHDTYFDFGRNMMWTTVSYGSKFQALYVKEWEKIIGGEVSIASEIAKRQAEMKLLRKE